MTCPARIYGICIYIVYYIHTGIHIYVRIITRGPRLPSQPNGWLRGRIRRELAGDDVCRPYPRQMALVEKDFLQLSEEGRTWLSTVRMFFVNDV